jgi:hypothetical protein
MRPLNSIGTCWAFGSFAEFFERRFRPGVRKLSARHFPGRLPQMARLCCHTICAILKASASPCRNPCSPDPSSLGPHAGAHASSTPTLVVPPIGSVTPAHHPTIVLELIFNAAPRSLSALELTFQLLSLPQDLWLLLYRRNIRNLLGTRSDSATRQNESRCREHQNILLHCGDLHAPLHSTPHHMADRDRTHGGSASL